MRLGSIFKTIGIFLGFLVIILILAYTIYAVFFREEKPPRGLVNVNGRLVNVGEFPIANINVNRPPVNINVPRELPVLSEIAQGGNTRVTRIVDHQVQGIAVVGSQLRYYDQDEGKFYQISADGTVKNLLTEEKFPQVREVAWSPSAKEAILTFPDGTNLFYNFEKKTQVTLPKEMKEIRFSPTGTEIGFEFVTDQSDKNFLGISNPNGSELRRVELLGEQSRNVEINWSPTKQVLANFRKTSGADQQEVYFIGLYGENFKLLEVPGRGFEGTWNKAGDKMLYSTYSSENDFNPELRIVDVGGDRTGQNETSVGLATWPSKCAIGSQSAYCGVPDALERGSGIFPELAQNASEAFWKINLRTGEKTKLANPLSEEGIGGFNAERVFLSSDEHLLYFVDRNTKQLHSIRLR